MASTHSTKRNRIDDAKQVANSCMQHDVSSELPRHFPCGCHVRVPNLISRLETRNRVQRGAKLSLARQHYISGLSAIRGRFLENWCVVRSRSGSSRITAPSDHESGREKFANGAPA